ncbi:hypothetical protein LSAT2_026249 [Lamellibrachia satsuma]|nr:hypothetical protein LSAT2_026249 [Lamellibrachia satsuma]
MLGPPSADPRRSLGGPSADPRRSLGGPSAVTWRSLGGPSAVPRRSLGGPSAVPRPSLGGPPAVRRRSHGGPSAVPRRSVGGPSAVPRSDQHGNLVRVKKGEDVESDGDYFEVMPDGTVRLKAGKKKIDINKLTDDDLRRLGIDPRNMTKEEIARKLKEMFGDQIEITRGGDKIGLKHIDDYGSDVDTDDLANDSDLDTSTLRGQKRIRVLMKRGGPAMVEQMKKLIEDSLLTDLQHTHPEERDASIDFLCHYRLVDPNKLDMYARAFVVEDDDKDGVVYPREAKIALEGVPSIQAISKKQLEYILKVLDIDRETKFTFRMFSVMTALAERVTHMDQYSKSLLDICNTMDIYRKMELYKSMFYCNVEGDRDSNYIKAESLTIELIAGGLNWDQQQFVMERMKPNEFREVGVTRRYNRFKNLFIS